MWYNVYLSLTFVLIEQTFNVWNFSTNFWNKPFKLKKINSNSFIFSTILKNRLAIERHDSCWQWQSYHSGRWPGPGSNTWLRRIHEFRQLGQSPLSIMSLQDYCCLLDCSVLLCSRDRNRTTRWRADILVVTDYLWFLVSLHRRLKVCITILFIGRLHFWSIKEIFLSRTYEDSVRHDSAIWNHDSLVTNNNRSSWYY